MNIRIFRQPTKDIQPDGNFYIDTLQYQTVHRQMSTTGVTGMETWQASDWQNVEIVEADSY